MKRGMKMYKQVFIAALVLLCVWAVLLTAKTHKEYELDTSRLNEASGLVRSIRNPGILYSHNDSGGENAIFAIDETGKLKCRIVIAGIKNRDWEEIAIAVDPQSANPQIYIGEIGDNAAKHPSIAIYKVTEPSLAMGDTLIVIDTYETINIQYEDGPRDAEAFFVDPQSRDIYIISKREEQVGIYHLAYPQSFHQMNIAQKMGQMQMSWVTAADISPNGKYILVKNYTGIRRFTVKRKTGIAHALQKKGKSMPYKLEPQGEAVCWDARGKGYFSLSEAAEKVPQILYYYR